MSLMRERASGRRSHEHRVLAMRSGFTPPPRAATIRSPSRGSRIPSTHGACPGWSRLRRVRSKSRPLGAHRVTFARRREFYSGRPRVILGQNQGEVRSIRNVNSSMRRNSWDGSLRGKRRRRSYLEYRHMSERVDQRDVGARTKLQMRRRGNMRQAHDPR